MNVILPHTSPPLFSVRNQSLVLVLLVMGLNMNTLFHSYVLDDIVVLTENRFVQKGIRGIPEIFSNDYVAGYSSKEPILTEARYRPLSLVLFALEYQFFGARPWVSHLINLLLFAALVLVLFRFLRHFVFPNANPYLAWITCLLFAVHPIHAEVIANVKSRDELMTFLLLLVSSHSFLTGVEQGKPRLFIVSLFCYFLALLCKETAITFLGIDPLLLFFFLHKSVMKSLNAVGPFLLLTAVWLLLRWYVVGMKHYPVSDITNSPYLYASAGEAFATKVFILFRYLLLLVFPFVLSSDYGYNQIPYVELSSWSFIGAFLLVLLLLVIAGVLVQRRSLVSFSILFFFITLSVGTNFLIDLGTPMAERMLFEPSLGFCMALAILLVYVSKKGNYITGMALCVILLLFSARTVARNRDWKDNETLFLKDVTTTPNSARLNLYACETLILKAAKETDAGKWEEDLDRAVYYGVRSVRLHDRFAYSWLRLGIARYLQHHYLNAADLLLYAVKKEPDDANALNWCRHLGEEMDREGNRLSREDRVEESVMYHLKAIELIHTANHHHEQ